MRADHDLQALARATREYLAVDASLEVDADAIALARGAGYLGVDHALRAHRLEHRLDILVGHARDRSQDLDAPEGLSATSGSTSNTAA